MNFVLDIPASILVAMGVLTLVFMAGRYTPAKRVGIILSTTIGAGCLLFLIFSVIVFWNTRGVS